MNNNVVNLKQKKVLRASKKGEAGIETTLKDKVWKWFKKMKIFGDKRR